MDIAGEIRAYIETEFADVLGVESFSDTTPLVGSILDSLALMNLLAFVEDHFDVIIEDTEVTVDNFRTVSDIERMVTAKTQAGGDVRA